MDCDKCGNEMVNDEGSHWTCNSCGYGYYLFKMTKKELREEARLAYLDGRHWNHGGGVNKGS